MKYIIAMSEDINKEFGDHIITEDIGRSELHLIIEDFCLNYCGDNFLISVIPLQEEKLIASKCRNFDIRPKCKPTTVPNGS